MIAACPYGIDMATEKDFVARGKSVQEVAERDRRRPLWSTLELERMVEAARVGNPKIQAFCNGCFTGKYPTRDAAEHLEALSAERAAART